MSYQLNTLENSILLEMVDGIIDRYRNTTHTEITLNQIKKSYKSEFPTNKWNINFFKALHEELKRHFTTCNLVQYKTHINHIVNENANWYIELRK